MRTFSSGLLITENNRPLLTTKKMLYQNAHFEQHLFDLILPEFAENNPHQSILQMRQILNLLQALPFGAACLVIAFS